MKPVSLLLTVIAVLGGGSQINGQFSDLCLPKPMREVPITLQIKKASELAACGKDGLLALPDLASLAEDQIMRNYRPSAQSSNCRLVSLVHTSCEVIGRQGQRVLIQYKANITCSDGCYYLDGFNQRNKDAINVYTSQVDGLLRASRTKSNAEFNYGSRSVEIFYFKGRKGRVLSACDAATVQNGVNKKIPACKCPSSCPNPCTLPPVTGRCRASIPRYYHNPDSGQCELFTYGGCGGNQNRFTTRAECEKACKVCPNGKVYLECGTDCPDTCENKDDGLRICNLRCVQGCFCPPGTVELGDECVAPEDCPSTNATVVVETCPEGMIYKECGTACPRTCENKDDDIHCITLCVPGCFCPDGKLLLQEDSEETKCVDREECLSVEQECPEGKIYKQCGTACPLTCENKDETIVCTRQCVPGCFCPDGYVENGDSCVEPEECDTDICSLPPATGPCRAYFPRYFYNTTSEQCERFIYGGCQGNDNNFETIEDCEAKCNETEYFECPDGKEYQECGTSCPTTCENKDQTLICTLQCVQGCFCPAGTVELGDECVAPEECPSTDVPVAATEIECPEGMVFDECGTACPTTCDNKDLPPRPCTLQCVPGCVCVGDTILLEEEGDVCVTEEECPN